MTEAQLKELAQKLADKLAEVDGLHSVEFVDKDSALEGEPAGIALEFEGHVIALGVLPI